MSGRKREFETILWNHFGGEIPAYVRRAGASFIDIIVAGSNAPKRVRLADVVLYYATEARNITSGCRSLAGIVGDWRPIDELARTCLGYFKIVNRRGLEREGRKHDMVLR